MSLNATTALVGQGLLLGLLSSLMATPLQSEPNNASLFVDGSKVEAASIPDGTTDLVISSARRSHLKRIVQLEVKTLKLLYSEELSSDDLLLLHDCPALVELSVSDRSALTASEETTLLSLPKLQRLQLLNCRRHEGAMFSGLEHCRSSVRELVTIVHDNHSLSWQNLRTVFPELSHFSHTAPLKPSDWESFDALSGLDTLALHSTASRSPCKLVAGMAFPHVRKLLLAGNCQLGHDVLTHLAEVSGLAELEFRFVRFEPDVRISSLSGFDDLQKLTLKGCEGGSESELVLSALRLPNLRELHLQPSGFLAVGDLAPPYLGANALRLAGASKSLECLDGYLDASVDYEAVEALCASRVIRRLKLRSHPIVSDTIMKALSEMHQLNELDWKGLRAETPAGYDELAQLTELKVLHLYGAVAAGKDFHRAMQRMKDLRDLKVTELTMSAKLADAIGSLRNLERLSLDGCRDLSDDLVGKLAANPKLLTLDLSNTDVTSKIGELLKEFSSVEQIKLNGCRGVDDEILPYLLETDSLRRLELYRTSLSEEAVNTLMDSLPNCQIRH